MNEICAISICVKNFNSVEMLNNILHDYRDFIIGRMGLPYKEKNVNIITVILDAPVELIAELKIKINNIDDIEIL